MQGLIHIFHLLFGTIIPLIGNFVKVKAEKPVKVAKVTEPGVNVKEKPVAEPVTKQAFVPVKVEQKALTSVSPEPTKVVKEETPAVVEKPQYQVAEENYRPVNVETPDYKISIPQETPVFTAFEQVQSRLPLVRKSFDED